MLYAKFCRRCSVNIQAFWSARKDYTATTNRHLLLRTHTYTCGSAFRNSHCSNDNDSCISISYLKRNDVSYSANVHFIDKLSSTTSPKFKSSQVISATIPSYLTFRQYKKATLLFMISINLAKHRDYLLFKVILLKLKIIV